MAAYAPPEAPLAVVFADAHLIALDKPAGLLSVPGRGPAKADCLEARLQAEIPEARHVHRLDMETSGLILFALSAEVHRALGGQFAGREIEKTYVARVAGVPEADAGRIDLPLMADWPNRPRQKVDHAAGKPALTEWRVLARGAGEARLALRPVTGRSHQLRVHLAEIGHPILGDGLYGGPPAPRLMLHAERLRVLHPVTGKPLSLTVPAPF